MIAYTLFVHSELDLVTRLIDELHNDTDYFYVHVDLQNKAMWRDLCECYATCDNIEVTSHHSLVWGGISQVANRKNKPKNTIRCQVFPTTC